jgi:hypothetical protein
MRVSFPTHSTLMYHDPMLSSNGEDILFDEKACEHHVKDQRGKEGGRARVRLLLSIITIPSV